MINRVAGEIGFRSGLRILPECAIQSLSLGSNPTPRIETRKLPLKGWQRHILGSHASEHGTFGVEVLSGEDERVTVVLLSHCHSYYEGTLQATPSVEPSMRA